MENLLYTKNDFVKIYFDLSQVYDFNIFQERIVISAQSFYGGSADAGPYFHQILPKEILDVYIKKSFLRNSYKVYLKLNKKKSFGGSIFSLNEILFTHGLRKENAEKLQKILLDFKNSIPIQGTEHQYSESIEYKNEELNKQINYSMNILLPKFLKAIIIIGLPVLILLLIILFRFFLV